MGLFDIFPIYIREEQFDVKNPDLKEMSIEKLLKEIARTEKEINTWQKEIDNKLNTDRYPIYVVKERLTNAKVYKDQLQSYLSNNFPAEEVKEAIKKYEEAEKKKKDDYDND